MLRSCLLSAEVLDLVLPCKFLVRRDKVRQRFFQSELGVVIWVTGNCGTVTEGAKVVRGCQLEGKMLASQSEFF